MNKTKEFFIILLIVLLTLANVVFFTNIITGCSLQKKVQQPQQLEYEWE